MENDEKNIKREFGLTTMATKNRTTVLVLTFIVLVLGLVSYINMPKAAFPEVSMPTIYIGTSHPGNSPVDMENLITRPLEKELNSISGVDEIKSTSIQDYSTIIVQFESDIEVDEALMDVKDAVDKAKSELPSDLRQDPNVFELNFAEFPIMNVNLSGDFSLEELNEFGEYLEDEFEKLNEISKVEIRGVQDKEVKINVDLHKMESVNVTFRDIESAIANENVTISGGNLLESGLRRTVRVVGEFDTPKQIENIVVKDEKQKLVYIRDIATVEFGYEDAKSYARLKKQPVVMLDVIKRSGENLLEASDKISAIIEKSKKEVFPSNLTISITNDQSNQTRAQVANLENSIYSGVILVVLVLLFFLGLRNALFVGLAIPMSMFISFMILGAIGYTVNMMVLFGLIMALGMLVDNGIVVVENIYRYMSEGYKPIAAAREAVGEVAWPIIASTATTLAAFVPLAFWPGMMGEFMVYLPVTLIIVLGSSLFVALVINPVATAIFMKISSEDDKAISRKTAIISGVILLLGILFSTIGMTSDKTGLAVLGNLMVFFTGFILLNGYVLEPLARKFQSSFLPWLENLYEKVLTVALKGNRSWGFFGGTILLLVFSIMLMAAFTPKVLFFPENQPKYLNIFIEHPIGTDIEEVNQFTKNVENRVLTILEPYEPLVESVIAQVGEGTSDPGDPNSAGNAATPHKARIQVNFVEMEFRYDSLGNEIKTSDIMNEMREKIGVYPGVSIAVDKDAAGPPTGKPINIEIRGLEYEKLIAISDDLKRIIQKSGIEGIENLKSDMELGKPELIFDIDREKARRLGLSSGQIATELRTSIFGKEISKYKLGEDDYPIMVRLDKKYRDNKDALLNKNITFRNQTTGKIHNVPISSVAQARMSSSFGSVRRKDLNRVITLFSNVLDGFNATEINNQLKALLEEKYTVPDGYEVAFTGEQEKQEEEMAFLGTALLIAVFMIFLIIVAQFNKMSAPVIILFSVILSTIGVFLGLVIFQMDFIVIMTMIGIISLAGIVVNNAIVLLDYTDLVKQRMVAEKREKDKDATLDIDEIRQAIAISGKTRLRPVLLTAITTVLGLVPLAIGLNIDFYGLFSSLNPNIWVGGDNVMFWGPMSWTIIFGITFATFLTLIIVPVMYMIVDKIKLSVGRSVV